MQLMQVNSTAVSHKEGSCWGQTATDTSALAQLMIPAESAHDTMVALGEVGLLQFKDLNPDASPFQKTYASQVWSGCTGYPSYAGSPVRSGPNMQQLRKLTVVHHRSSGPTRWHASCASSPTRYARAWHLRLLLSGCSST